MSLICSMPFSTMLSGSLKTGKEAVQFVDAALRVQPRHAHVTLIVQTGMADATATADRHDHGIARSQRLDAAADLLDNPDHLVTHDYPVAVFGRVLQLVAEHVEVRAVQAHLLDPNHNLARFRDTGLRHFEGVHTIPSAQHAYRQHLKVPPSRVRTTSSSVCRSG
jgi:hypothetical protein